MALKQLEVLTNALEEISVLSEFFLLPSNRMNIQIALCVVGGW